MNNTNTLSPPQIAIACFGGVRSMARVLGCDPSAVSRWKKVGTIPAGYQRKVLEHAWERGIDLTAHDLIFGRHQ